MITVEEYEARKAEKRKRELASAHSASPMGVQCPKCGGELCEIGARCLTVMPPIRVSETECNKCGHRMSL